MLPLGGLLVFAAYTFGGYGYVLVRGWDIPFRAWVSPLHPYTWPSGAPPLIPDYQIFPGQGSANAAPSNAPTASQAASAQRAAAAARAANRQPPGSVAGRL